MVCDFRFAHSIPMWLPVGSPLLRCGTIRLVSAALFEMHDEWIALPRQHLPEGDMGDICRKLSFGSSTLPNVPKCNVQLIPNSMTRDTTWRTEWHSLRYPPAQVIGSHLPMHYWAVDLRVS